VAAPAEARRPLEALPTGGPAVAVLHWLKARLADIFSFETALISLIYFPDIKSAANAGSMSTGLLVAFSGLCFAGAVGLLVQGRLKLRKDAGVLLWLWLAFVAWAVLSLLWTPSVFAAQRAIVMLLSMSTCTLAGVALVISSDPQRVRRYYAGVLIMGLWLAWASFLTYRHVAAGGASASNIRALGLNYLILGRAIGAAALVCAYYALYSRWRWYWRALAGLGAVLTTGVMLLLGGRSPLIGTGLCLLLLGLGALTPPRTVRGLLAQIMVGAAVLGLVWLAANKLTGAANSLTTLHRIEYLLQGGLQTNDRYVLYTQTWIELEHGPVLGQGVASWPVRMGYGDRHLHAHDILLEIWFDLGLPGLLLMFGMWWWVLHRYWPPARWRGQPYAPLALALFANALLAALTSGDYSEQWWLYANMAMLLLVPLGRPAHASPGAVPVPVLPAGHRHYPADRRTG
jgi:hypothetical protein